MGVLAFFAVGILISSQIKSLLSSRPPTTVIGRLLMTRICALLAFCRSGSASRLVVTGLEYPNPGRSTCMHGDGSLMWMASVMSGGRIFAIATTPKSEKFQLVGLSSFAKSMAVTTNVGTMQIKGRAARAARQREAEEDWGK
jgi:hypothetical protein